MVQFILKQKIGAAFVVVTKNFLVTLVITKSMVNRNHSWGSNAGADSIKYLLVFTNANGGCTMASVCASGLRSLELSSNYFHVGNIATPRCQHLKCFWWRVLRAECTEAKPKAGLRGSTLETRAVINQRRLFLAVSWPIHSVSLKVLSPSSLLPASLLPDLLASHFRTSDLMTRATGNQVGSTTYHH